MANVMGGGRTIESCGLQLRPKQDVCKSGWGYWKDESLGLALDDDRCVALNYCRANQSVQVAMEEGELVVSQIERCAVAPSMLAAHRHW